MRTCSQVSSLIRLVHIGGNNEIDMFPTKIVLGIKVMEQYP